LLASLDERVQTFTRLGLTLRQAKVYLALSQCGMSSARTISTASNVPREGVYRVLLQLRKLGLVEKPLTKPSMFIAISVEDAVSILMERRTKEFVQTQVEAEELIKKNNQKKIEITLQEEKPQFVLIPQKETLALRIKKAIENAQTSIDIICTKPAFPRMLFILLDELKEALKIGVKVRWIAEKSEELHPWLKTIQALRKNPCFTLRVVSNHPKARLGIYDKKEVFISVNPETGAFDSHALWSNNPSLLTIIQDYFEVLWLTAIEENS
jgi:sugar-specific transcriptional regulator TrmB